jgi:hypothetical protein
MCVHVVFDNVDVSPRPVQDAVVRLLQSMSPDDGVLMICACRPETLVNWDHGATILDVISHVGPNAHEVVVNRLSAFLKSPPDGTELTDLLQASREPKDFLQNLEFIAKRIEDGHFARFFNDYFGSRIRNALVFAMRSVDLAASRHFAAPTNPSQEITDHDLERRLYRPWGLSTPVRGISNIFGCSPNRERRLAGVRILVFLYPYAGYAKTVEQICQHMGIFGYSREETIISLNSMLHARLVIARTKERYRLGTYDSCREEPVKITDMGEGIYRRFTEYSYVTGIMYDTICSERLYGSIRSEEQDLLSVLYTLRIFLIETVSTELSELRSVADKHGMDDYNAAYEGAAISPALYHSIIPTVTRIGLAQKKDGVATYTSVLETGFRMLEEDYNAGLADKLVKDFEISVHPDEDVMSMFDRLRDEYLGFASAR